MGGDEVAPTESNLIQAPKKQLSCALAFCVIRLPVLYPLALLCPYKHAVHMQHGQGVGNVFCVPVLRVVSFFEPDVL